MSTIQTPLSKIMNSRIKVALKDFSRTGPIGFQGLHGKAQAPVWYRNLKIKPLD